MSEQSSRRLRRILISTSAFVALSSPAFGQAASAPTVETVVVTAQKTEQNVQVVPIAITALTARALEQRGITDVSTLSNAVPNVNFDAGVPFGGSTEVLTAYIRGIGQQDFAFNQDPGVGVYLDGVYLARSVGANTDLLDVERIEVLRGPQGTLFGRNTIGGAVSIVTRDPGDEFGYQAEVTGGDFNRFDIRGYVDLPITDSLHTSVSFSSKRRDGFLERIPFPNDPSDPRYAAALAASGLFAPPNAFYVGSPAGDCFGQASCNSATVDGIVAMAGNERHDTEGGQGAWDVRAKAVYQPAEHWKITATFDYSDVNSSGQATHPFLINPDYTPPQYPGMPPQQAGLGSLANACLTPVAVILQGFGVPMDLICGPRGTPGSTFAPAGAAFANLVPGMWYLANFDGDPNNNRLPYGPWFVNNDPDKSYSTGPTFDHLKQYGGALTFDWDVSDKMHLKSITAMRGLHFEAGLDGDGSPLNIHEVSFDERQHQFSQEVQLTGKLFNDSVDYVLGAYYFSEGGHIHDYVTFPALFIQVDGRNTLKTVAWAGFFHFDWHITDQLSLILGGRYTEEDKDFSGFQNDLNAFGYKISGCYDTTPGNDPITDACRILLGFPDPNNPLRFFPPGSFNLKFDNFSPNVGIHYQFDDDTMAYATYSEGFKTGNWTTRLSTPHPTYDNDLHFDPEFAKTWEAGIKTEFWDRRARLNLAAFFTQYDGIQLNVQSGISPTLRNVGDAEIWGAEAEFQALFTDNFLVNVGLGYAHGEYTHIDPPPPGVCGVCSNGVRITLDNKLPKMPEWKLNITPQYTVRMGDSGQLVFLVDYTYTDTVYNDVQNTTELTNDPTNIFNASVTWQAPSGNWDIGIGGTNLTDERYIVTGYNQGGIQIVYGSYNRPREWFATLRIRN